MTQTSKFGGLQTSASAKTAKAARDEVGPKLAVHRFSSPDEAKLTSLKGKIKSLQAKEIKTGLDAAQLCPDEVSISYTFNFPEATDEFIAFFRGDFEVFATNVFDRSNSKTQVATRGLSNYSLRCPFLACAFCIRLDVDSYMYTIPGIVAPLRDSETGFTPANSGAAPAPASNPAAADQTNAVFDSGTISNRIAYYLYNFFGLRIELGCNDVVSDKPLSYSGFEVNNHLGICANTNVDVTEDLLTANQQLTKLPADSVFAGKQVYAPNEDPCCGDSSAPTLAPAPIASASSGAYQYTGLMAGCIPLPKVPILAGMGLEATLYTRPGQEDKRDEMLNMVRSGLFTPSLSNPDVRHQGYGVTWANATALTIEGPCGNVTVAQGEKIPEELLIITPATDTSPVIKAAPRWGRAWIGAFTPAGGIAQGTNFADADISAHAINVSIGTAAQYRVRYGKLVLTFAIKGSYMSWEELVDYLKGIASVNKRLATIYTAQSTVLQAILENADSKDGIAGVAGIEDLRDQIMKQGGGKK